MHAVGAVENATAVVRRTQTHRGRRAIDLRGDHQLQRAVAAERFLSPPPRAAQSVISWGSHDLTCQWHAAGSNKQFGAGGYVRGYCKANATKSP